MLRLPATLPYSASLEPVDDDDYQQQQQPRTPTTTDVLRDVTRLAVWPAAGSSAG